MLYTPWQGWKQEVTEVVSFCKNGGKHGSVLIHLHPLSTKGEKAKFANSVDLGEVAQNEPPHLELHSLPSSL